MTEEAWNSGERFTVFGDRLKREHFDSHWSLFAVLQRTYDESEEEGFNWGFMSNGGREKMERGMEEEAEWRNVKYYNIDREEFLFVVYVWRALKSPGEELRGASDEEKKKVREIIGELKQKEKTELDKFAQKSHWTRERWRDEMIQQMNYTQEMSKRKFISVRVMNRNPLFRCASFSIYYSHSYTHSKFEVGPRMRIMISFQS
ncbi:uncharacterized protein LOC142344296 [Convolutriloba macropyga]|uniref:uncharacterized protein LOC142344296 n=1 Tax=Convolutriloba macropyga TaxID=536237 RepID=UPI003F51ADE9